MPWFIIDILKLRMIIPFKFGRAGKEVAVEYFNTSPKNLRTDENMKHLGQDTQHIT
jgi:hypothetical protein